MRIRAISFDHDFKIDPPTLASGARFSYAPAMLEVLLATYTAVFVAEIVGDKLLYTSGVLATRFRWGAVIFGMSAAFMGKMAVAVGIGAAIGKLLPPWLVAALTAVSFVGV